MSDDLLTIPNVLSFARLALIPVFLGFLITGQDVLALVVLVAGGVTDFLDGFLARRLHQVTRLGKLLDPVADRLTILSATIGLTYRGFLPMWLLLVVLARDVGMLCLGVVLARHRAPPPSVTWVGKAATFLLLSALPLGRIGSCTCSQLPRRASTSRCRWSTPAIPPAAAPTSS